MSLVQRKQREMTAAEKVVEYGKEVVKTKTALLRAGPQNRSLRKQAKKNRINKIWTAPRAGETEEQVGSDNWEVGG